MVDNNTQELDAAVTALSRAAEAIERRIEANDETTKELTRARKSYLTDTVERLLPAITGSVLKILREEVPAFVTSPVKEGFADNEKIFGLFAGKAYRQKLALLQTRLASHLDQAKYRELRSLDTDLSNLSLEKNALIKQGGETRELLKLMHQARKSTAPLPVKLSEQITQINKTVRTGFVPPHKRSSPVNNTVVSRSSQHRYDSQPNDDDLLIYMVSGIPTSMRTLLIDSIADSNNRQDDTEVFRGQGGSFGGAGASADYAPTQSNDSYQSPADTSTSSIGSATAMAGAAVLGGVAAVEIANIATDDSLGAFS